MRVFVYFNLHKKVWSVKALSGENRGRVVAHASAVGLDDCEMRVSESGRQRVLREQRKNVHAGIVGTLNGLREADWRYPNHEWYGGPDIILNGEEITYNPYKYDSFVRVRNQTPVTSAKRVILDRSGVIATRN